MIKFYYKVYCFFITKEPEHLHSFHIGVFDSKEKAENAVKNIKNKPGFCEHQNRIRIRRSISFRQPQLLNNVYWEDGFDTYTYHK